MSFYRSRWLPRISPTHCKFKEYWHLFWGIWKNHKITVCEIRASSQDSVKLHSFDTTGLWVLFEISTYRSLYVSMSHGYKSMHTHTDMGLWASSNSFTSILLPNKSLCSCWWYRTPRRSLKIIWSVRGMTVKWGFAHFPNAYKKSMFQGFPAQFCLKLALFWRCHMWLALSWHIFHRKPSWTWSKGFVLPSEIPAGVCGSVGGIPGAGPEPPLTLLQLLVAEFLQTSWLG